MNKRCKKEIKKRFANKAWWKENFFSFQTDAQLSWPLAIDSTKHVSKLSLPVCSVYFDPTVPAYWQPVSTGASKFFASLMKMKCIVITITLQSIKYENGI